MSHITATSVTAHRPSWKAYAYHSAGAVAVDG